jgi:hypothetical protein
MDYIIECVSTRRTPVVTAKDGLAAVRVADAIMSDLSLPQNPQDSA